MRLARFIRRRYPYTAGAVLYVLAAAAMLPFGPVRKWGLLMLAVLAVAVVNVAAQHAARRSP